MYNIIYMYIYCLVFLSSKSISGAFPLQDVSAQRHVLSAEATKRRREEEAKRQRAWIKVVSPRFRKT